MKEKYNLFKRFQNVLLAVNTTVIRDEKKFDKASDESKLYLYPYRKKIIKPASTNYHFTIKAKQKTAAGWTKTEFVVPNDCLVAGLRYKSDYNPNLQEIEFMYFSSLKDCQRRKRIPEQWVDSQVICFLSYLTDWKRLDNEELICLKQTLHILENMDRHKMDDSINALTELLQFHDQHRSLKYYYPLPKDNFRQALAAIISTVLLVLVALAIGFVAAYAAATCFVLAGCIIIGILSSLATTALLSYPLHKFIDDYLGICSFKNLIDALFPEEQKLHTPPPYLSLAQASLGFFNHQKLNEDEQRQSFLDRQLGPMLQMAALYLD